jgi:hypothetical protein
VKTGTPEGEAGSQVTQRWNVKYEISGRDSKKWRPPRGVELVQQSSAILKLKRKLDTNRRGHSRRCLDREVDKSHFEDELEDEDGHSRL